jgi:hypothetical protein
MKLEHAQTFLKVLEQKKWMMEHGVEEYPRVTLKELEKRINYWMALIKDLSGDKTD